MTPKKLAERKKAALAGDSKYLSPDCDQTIIYVGTATCGIAAGAEEIYNSLRNLPDVIVVPTGCSGMCYAEPLIEIKQPQSESFYIQTQDLGDSVPNPPQGEAMPPLAPQLETALRAVSGKSFEGGLEGTFSKVPPKKGYKITLRNCGVINPDKIDDYIAVGGYEALAKAVTELGREGVIDEIKKSGLRGRGGAGFPTGLKWEFGAKATGEKKYIICNADEGDPGAFMDRSVLEGDPHSVLEAMAIAGFAVGADEGVIYIRAEYPLAVKRLREAIAQAEEIGLLGQNIFETGFAFKIRISLGAGAFVCGEETALLNSLEGKRGEPRLRPPFPAQKGLWQCPTVNNNVETFANVPEIILRGADWFRGIGTEKSPGTKVFALAGKVNNVGLIEVPMGTTLREIVYDFGGGLPGGKKLKAVQTGGPSGGCISNLDLGVDYESLAAVGSMMGSGGMIVTDEDDCMVNLAKFYLDFTMEESCGKCSPCRIGNTRLYEILEKITSGNGEESDLTQLEELAHTIKNTSLCGLGNSAPNPVLSTLKFFRDEYIAHVNKKCPAKACRDLIRYTITEKCIGCGICAKACPVSCISGKPKERHVIEQEKCIKCGECLAVCPPKVGAVAAE